jgi:hypothetical protein
MVGQHVAVGTRASIAIQCFQPPIEECEKAAGDGTARLTGTQRSWALRRRVRPHQHRRAEDERADNQQ